MNYEKQAHDFLKRFHIDAMIEKGQDQCRAPWLDDQSPCGTKYLVTLKRNYGKDCVSFDFWGSIAGKKTGTPPSFYDVLSCIAMDCHCPETFDDFCFEYGYDTDSRKAYATWERCLAFSKELQAFFTQDAIEALQEIQ